MKMIAKNLVAELIESGILVLMLSFTGFTILYFVLFYWAPLPVVSQFYQFVLFFTVMFFSIVGALVVRPFKRTFENNNDMMKYLDIIMNGCRNNEVKNLFIKNLMQMCDSIEGIAFWYKDQYDRYIFADATVRKVLFDDLPLNDVIGKTDSEIMCGDDSQEREFRHEDRTLRLQDLPKINDANLLEMRICNLTDFIARSFKSPCRFYEEVNGKALDVWKSPIVTESGQILGTVGSFIDVTYKQEVMREFIKSMEGMGEAVKIDGTPNYYIKRHNPQFEGFE